METVKSLARYQYAQGDTSNPYIIGSKEYAVFEEEVLKCKFDEMRNDMGVKL